jgi:hypothetical protein
VKRALVAVLLVAVIASAYVGFTTFFGEECNAHALYRGHVPRKPFCLTFQTTLTPEVSQ